MGLTFLEVPFVFTILSFEFTKSNYRDFIANDERPPIYPTLIHWIIRFAAMLESYCRLQSKPKTVPVFKDALLLTWPTLPEKAIDNGVKLTSASRY